MKAGAVEIGGRAFERMAGGLSGRAVSTVLPCSNRRCFGTRSGLDGVCRSRPGSCICSDMSVLDAGCNTPKEVSSARASWFYGRSAP